MHAYVSSQKPSHIYRNHNMIAYARMSGIGTVLPSATVAVVYFDQFVLVYQKMLVCISMYSLNGISFDCEFSYSQVYLKFMVIITKLSQIILGFIPCKFTNFI